MCCYFPDSLTTKTQCVFWHSAASGLMEVWLFWFTWATSLTQCLWWWAWHPGWLQNRAENTPKTGKLPLHLQSAQSMGKRLCMPTASEETRNKAFYNSPLSLTEGNSQSFFFFSSVKICLSPLLIFSSQSDAMQISAQNINPAKCLLEL